MKFLMTYTGDPSAPPPTPETLAAIGKFTAEKLASGTVLMTGGIIRPTKGCCDRGPCRLPTRTTQRLEFERAASLADNTRRRERLLARAAACAKNAT